MKFIHKTKAALDKIKKEDFSQVGEKQLKNNKAKLEELKDNNTRLKAELMTFFPKSKTPLKQPSKAELKSVVETRPAPSKSPLPLSRSINLTNEKFRELMAQENQKIAQHGPDRVERSPNMQRASIISTSMTLKRREDVSPSRTSRFLKENEIKARYLHRRERALTCIKNYKKDLYALKLKKFEQMTQEDPSVFEVIHKKLKPNHANMLRKYFKQVVDAKNGHREMRDIIDKAKQWNKAFLENEVG